MSANYVQKGEILDYTNKSSDTAIAYHDVVVFGSRIGVANSPIAPGEQGTIAVTGVWEISADNSVFSAGDTVLWDVKNAKAIKTAAEGTVAVSAGYAVSDKSASDSTVSVKIGV